MISTLRHRAAVPELVGTRIAWRSMTAADRLVVIGYGLQAISPMIDSVVGDDSLRHIGYAGMLLQGSGALLTPKCLSSASLGIKLLMLYLVGLLVYGLLRGNWFSYLAADVCAFMLCALVLPRRAQLLQQVLNLALLLAPVGVGISAVDVLFGLMPAGFGERIVLRHTESKSYLAAYQMLMPSLYVPLFGPLLPSRWLIASCYLGVVIMLLWGLVTATRGYFLSAVTALIISYLVRRRASSKTTTAVLYVVFIGVVAIVSTQIWSLDSMEAATENLAGRFQPTEDITSGRAWEADSLLETELQGPEVVVGKGLGGSQRGGFWRYFDVEHGVPGMHYGHLHLVLKGGLLLLLLIAMPVGKSMYRCWRYKGTMARSCLATQVQFVFMNYLQSQFLGSLSNVFFWQAVGYGLTLGSTGSTVSSGLPSSQSS
jgi:hypothetical protein